MPTYTFKKQNDPVATSPVLLTIYSKASRVGFRDYDVIKIVNTRFSNKIFKQPMIFHRIEIEVIFASNSRELLQKGLQ